MKKIISLFTILVIILTFASCGKTNDFNDSGMRTDEVKNDDGTTSFIRNGTETFYFNVGKDEIYEIEMNFKNESGSINAYIAKDGDKDQNIYTGSDIPSGTFTVTVSEPGEYQICYKASDYVGEYTYSAAEK